MAPASGPAGVTMMRTLRSRTAPANRGLELGADQLLEQVAVRAHPAADHDRLGVEQHDQVGDAERDVARELAEDLHSTGVAVRRAGR